MSRGTLTTLCAFIIGTLIVISGFFLLDIEKFAIHYWAFGSLLFSLAVSSLGIITLILPKKYTDNLFYNSGISSAILIYQIIVVISIIYTNKFAENLYGFIFLQIAVNALFVIAAIIITAAAGRIHDSNEITSEKLQSGEYDKPKRGGF